MTIDRYFHIVFNILNRHWAIAGHDTTFESLGPGEGHIVSTVTFLDDSYLDFEEFVQIVQDKVEFGYYKYQYIKEQESLFRYDNFSLHPGVSYPYHHKHLSGHSQVIELDKKPTLISVIEEIAHLF